jgi:hypothetical protein
VAAACSAFRGAMPSRWRRIANKKTSFMSHHRASASATGGNPADAPFNAMDFHSCAHSPYRKLPH